MRKLRHPYECQFKSRKTRALVSSAQGWPERHALLIVAMLLILTALTAFPTVFCEIRYRLALKAWKQQAISEITFPASADDIFQWVTKENAHGWPLGSNHLHRRLAVAPRTWTAGRTYTRGGWFHAPAMGR